MIRFILALILLCLCMFVGYLVRTFPATVSINVMGYTAQTNLVVWTIVSLILAFILMTLFKIVHFIWRSPQIFSRNIETRKARKADILLKKGLNDLITGKYHRGERRLAKGGMIAEHIGHSAVLFYENAAIAADRQQATDRRDEYLLKARHNDDGRHHLVTRLSEAELAVNHKEFIQAKNLLENLRASDSKNPRIAELLDQTYASLKDWEAAWHNLKTIKTLSAAEKRAKRKIYAKGMLKDTLNIETFEELSDQWHQLPAEIRNEKDMILLYSSSLAENGHQEQAADFLSTQIKKSLDLDYIQAYSQLTKINFQQALHNMKKWSKTFSDDPIFFFSWAQIAFEAKDFTLAEGYIEASLKSHSSPEAFVLWAQILEARNQPQAALAAYRQSVISIKEQKSKLSSGELLLPPEHFSH